MLQAFIGKKVSLAIIDKKASRFALLIQRLSPLVFGVIQHFRPIKTDHETSYSSYNQITMDNRLWVQTLITGKYDSTYTIVPITK